MKIEIYFDGGCVPNPGEKYGSYEVVIDGNRKHKEPRLQLGHGTNNEAEFEILIAALKRIASYVERRKKEKKDVEEKDVEISMFTDSKIVANRISGKNKKGVKALQLAADCAGFLGEVEQHVSAKKEAERRMARLAQECFELLAKFKSFQIEWKPRDLNVSKFGH